MKTPPPLRPQLMQPIHNKIGGHRTLRKKEAQIIRRRQQKTKQFDLRLRGEIVIARDDPPTITPSTGVGTKPNRRLGVQRDTEIAGRGVSERIDAMEVVKDDIRLRNLFFSACF